MTNSTRLRRRIEIVLPELISASQRLVAHPHYRELYPQHLFLVFSMIRASIPLMQCALQRIRASENMHPIYAMLETYFEEHIPEELHHDEWALRDLECLGITKETVLERMPSSTVASVVGAQYYWIRHFSPLSLIGYIAVLEGYPPDANGIQRTIDKTGLPETAFTTLRKHALLDKCHRDDLNALLDRMPLREEHFNIIGTSAFHTIRQVSIGLRDVIDSPIYTERAL